MDKVQFFDLPTSHKAIHYILIASNELVWVSLVLAMEDKEHLSVSALFCGGCILILRGIGAAFEQDLLIFKFSLNFLIVLCLIWCFHFCEVLMELIFHHKVSGGDVERLLKTSVLGGELTLRFGGSGKKSPLH